jgi:hypothetical protein
MTGLHFSKTNKEATKVSKRILAVAIIATLVLALGATAAFAEGYNSPQEYTRATGYFSGPHGGYTTTTNKCADCHSTHYAAGSFMLLRANSREAACDYCHGGGGGSTVNIMMDNDYVINDGGDFWLDGSAESTTTTGYGTGHTLGYTGNAPADINPAYTSADGFACFDCHSPHGNSARIIATIGNPGRAMGTNNVVVAPGQPGFLGLQKNGNNLVDSAGEWGIDPTHGNFKWFGDPWATNPTARPADDTAGGRLIYRPIWPAGRFLLLKDPHSTAAEGQADTVVTSPANETADNGVNKYMIDWDEPMGPADGGYGGYQDNDSNQPFPFAPVVNGNGGFASLSEFCVDCHDGTAGASTQPANVWQPAGVSGSAAGAYGVVYAHDTQPRH